VCVCVCVCVHVCVCVCVYVCVFAAVQHAAWLFGLQNVTHGGGMRRSGAEREGIWSLGIARVTEISRPSSLTRCICVCTCKCAGTLIQRLKRGNEGKVRALSLLFSHVSDRAHCCSCRCVNVWYETPYSNMMYKDRVRVSTTTLNGAELVLTSPKCTWHPCMHTSQCWLVRRWLGRLISSSDKETDWRCTNDGDAQEGVHGVHTIVPPHAVEL
jgi:hypothetical protein